MTFTNLNKSASPSFTNESKNSSTFTAISRSGVAIGTKTFDEIGTDTFDTSLGGKPVGHYTFDELIGTDWTNQAKS